MTLESLNLIAQIVGVLLIPASLIFVGMQMRQHHTIERGNAQRDILDQTREWWASCVADQETFDAFSAGLADFGSLSRYQQARFNALGFDLQHIVEGAFFQHRAGLINASSHEGYMIAYLAILNTPGGRQWWSLAAKVGNAELCNYLSARLAAEAASLPLWTDLLPFLRSPTPPVLSSGGEGIQCPNRMDG